MGQCGPATAAAPWPNPSALTTAMTVTPQRLAKYRVFAATAARSTAARAPARSLVLGPVTGPSTRTGGAHAGTAS